jgi:hypothetical protein
VSPTCGWPDHIRDDFDAKVQDYKAAIKNSGSKSLTRQVTVRTHCDQEREWDKCIEQIKQEQAKSNKPPGPKDKEKLDAHERLENYRARAARRIPQPLKSGSGSRITRYPCRDVDVDHCVEDVLSNNNGCDNLMPRNTHMNNAWGGAMSSILKKMEATGAAITEIKKMPCTGKSPC